MMKMMKILMKHNFYISYAAYDVTIKKILQQRYFYFYFANRKQVNFTLKKKKNFLRLKYKKLIFFKKFNYLKWLYLMFMTFIRNGKKLTNLNFYLKIIFFLKKKFFYKKKIIHYFFVQIFFNILPVLSYSTLTKRNVSTIYPIPIINNIKNQKKKILSLSIRWIRAAIISRKEKTVFLRLFSELNDIRMRKGASIKSKRNYYQQFFITRSFERLKKFTWI